MRSRAGSGRLARWTRRLAVITLLGAFNVPVIVPWATARYHGLAINRASYKRTHGHWDVLEVPPRFQVRSIHAALLRTGKVLLIAGSGNDRRSFEAGTFKSLLWDPRTNAYKLIDTPDDLFCGGHAFLPDGKLLIAGGTRRYETVEKAVHNAAGVMTVSNHGARATLPDGTTVTARDGRVYRTRDAVALGAGEREEVWVTAAARGSASVVTSATRFTVSGRPAVRARADHLTLDKQEYQGSDKSYVFDPAAERYRKVDDLTLARWYPTLVGLKDGKVLSVAGLDGFGRIIQGESELYDPRTQRWQVQPHLKRTFPTYPALFAMPGGGDRLFYTGSNSGYGDPHVGRTPGIWNLDVNTFAPVRGMRAAERLESSGSVLLPPAQRQRYIVVGGGGVGESDRATARIDVADLRARRPRWRPAGSLAAPTRYPNAVLTPDDKVLITGGARDYRGRGNSDLLICQLYDPQTGSLERMADPTVGRNYHSEALLLPDGRVMTIGSDSLYNATDTGPGTFEKRIEIYSPPYLYHGRRPALPGGPRQLERGRSATLRTPDADAVRSARLVRPSAVTHTTDVEQRSIALRTRRVARGVRVTVPRDAGLVRPGWYMLFVRDGSGTPSVARWVHVV